MLNQLSHVDPGKQPAQLLKLLVDLKSLWLKFVSLEYCKYESKYSINSIHLSPYWFFFYLHKTLSSIWSADIVPTPLLAVHVYVPASSFRTFWISRMGPLGDLLDPNLLAPLDVMPYSEDWNWKKAYYIAHTLSFRQLIMRWIILNIDLSNHYVHSWNFETLIKFMNLDMIQIFSGKYAYSTFSFKKPCKTHSL